MQISPLLFNQQFSRFNKIVRAKSSRGFVSFREGWPAKEEGYKEYLRNEALFRLDSTSWKPSEIGKGRILQKVIDAIEINEPRRRIKNNLVDWPNRYGRKHQSHHALLDAKSNRSARSDLERWFFDLFKTKKSEEKAFESFRVLAGNRFDIVAYLFFLKDWNRFMPIAPTTFDKAFRLLNIDLITSGRCSWSNYTRYNEALQAVRVALRDTQGIRDARLIDAHSFCWMLIPRKLQIHSQELVIPLPKPIKSLKGIVIEESELTTGDHFDDVDEDKFLAQQAMQRRLGKLAQDVALESERMRVAKAGFRNLNLVKPVWKQWKRGYDILSSEVNGKPRHIEVKAARKSGRRLSFFLTRHEWRISQMLPNYYFYLVLNASGSNPRVLTLKASQVRERQLKPINYLAAFAGSL